jgi:hypothetical protein
MLYQAELRSLPKTLEGYPNGLNLQSRFCGHALAGRLFNVARMVLSISS